MKSEEVINTLIREVDSNKISDGYHTFGELYNHRIELYIALCRQYEKVRLVGWIDNRVWRSKIHSDGTIWDGWFLLGIAKNKGLQITYHIPISKWEECNFAETLDIAPEYDGHTSEDVLSRLRNL